jgi:4-oxalomesaconate tautomerase
MTRFTGKDTPATGSESTSSASRPARLVPHTGQREDNEMLTQTRIPCVLMRGGTSKGPFFLAADLPATPELRDRVLLAVMGSPDLRQIDGLGGATPLTSKVAIVGPSERDDADVEYLFAQVKVDEPKVDISPNCGNMLAGVGAFAIEAGLVQACDPVTRVRVYMSNSGKLAELAVQTPGGRVSYQGDARIDGVPGTSAPLTIDFLDTAGSLCGSLLPTGNRVDQIEGMAATCIDNGMPVVLLRAEDLGVSGYEAPEQLEKNTRLRERLEAIRLAAGPRMNLGDVSDKVVPKMCLVARPRQGGTVCSRTFIPHVCHTSVGVLGAVTVATACVLEGSVAHGLAVLPAGNPKLMSVEHPTGEFSVEIDLETNSDGVRIKRSALLRTTRRLMEGYVLVSADVWDGRTR